MNDDFWDFAIGYGGHRADGFADFVRLMRLGKVARPRNVVTQKDLQMVLDEEGVELSAGAERTSARPTYTGDPISPLSPIKANGSNRCWFEPSTSSEGAGDDMQATL